MGGGALLSGPGECQILLKEEALPAGLRLSVVHIIRVSLDHTISNNYWPVSNLLFLGKLLELVMVSQFQWVLDETEYMDPI